MHYTIAMLMLMLFTALPLTVNADKIHFGKRDIYFRCQGKGSPTVILESGFRNNSDVWTVPAEAGESIFAQIAKFTRVCVYDRPGTVGWQASSHSRSSPLTRTETAQGVVEDLHQLLELAKINGPYVLVGHSLGGLFVRLYARTYPKEVVGLVLVDAFSEFVSTRLKLKDWQAYRAYILKIPAELQAYKGLETLDLDAAIKAISKAAAKKPLENIPVIVISRGKAAPLPADFPVSSAILEEGWRQSQSDLAKLDPEERQIIAGKSQHYVQVTESGLIVDAIARVVQKTRSKHMQIRAH